MTTTRQTSRYRSHELAFDRTDLGHVASCSCGWPRGRQRFLDESEAHYAGAEHLGLMAYRRLALQGLVEMAAPQGPALWEALFEHRQRLGDEARTVVDVVAHFWPERLGIRGGG